MCIRDRLTESEKAKKVRSLILDFVITTINEKTGGGTKYINRRDVHYLPAAITEENYRKNLTSAINQYVDGHPTYKYSQITDFIYKAVFKENAKEYREVLKLDSKDNVCLLYTSNTRPLYSNKSIQTKELPPPTFKSWWRELTSIN